MSMKLGKSACVLALPLALALTVPPALAGIQQDPHEKTETKTVTKTKSGNTVTRDATVTRADGKTRTSHDTWTKDGNTVTHKGETTFANGKTATRESTTVRDRNTITRESKQTGPNGGTTVATSIHDWQPGSLNRTTTTTRTTTGPAGTRHAKSMRDAAPREHAVEVDDKP